MISSSVCHQNHWHRCFMSKDELVKDATTLGRRLAAQLEEREMQQICMLHTSHVG